MYRYRYYDNYWPLNTKWFALFAKKIHVTQENEQRPISSILASFWSYVKLPFEYKVDFKKLISSFKLTKWSNKTINETSTSLRSQSTNQEPVKIKIIRSSIIVPFKTLKNIYLNDLPSITPEPTWEPQSEIEEDIVKIKIEMMPKKKT